MKIRKITDYDHKMLEAWWKANGEPIDMEYVPPTTFVVEDNSYQPLVAASFIFTNASIGWIEYLIGNPEVKGEVRRAATRQLNEYLESYGRVNGCKRLFCMSPSPGLERYYEELGYTKTLGVTCMIKVIENKKPEED